MQDPDNSLFDILLQEKPWAALRAVHKKDGRLALSQFRRLKQLGTGDVGLVDMVELQDGTGRWGLLPVLFQGVIVVL